MARDSVINKPHSISMKTILPCRPGALLLVCVGTFLAFTPSRAEDRDYRPGLFGRVFGPPPGPRRLIRVRVVRQKPAQQTYQASGPAVIYSEEPAVNPPTPVQDENAGPRQRQRMEIPINGNRPVLRSEYSNSLGARQLEPSIQMDENGRPITSTPSDANRPAINAKTQVNAPETLAPNPARLTSDNVVDPQASKTDTAAKSSTQDQVKTTASKPTPSPSSFPLGTRSTRAGFVKSPYEPFNELDATGLYAGMLARDPTTGKIFRVP